MADLDLAHSTAGAEIRRRAPWIGLALLAGIVMVLVGNRFERLLSGRIELVFFVPVIVYLSDCIGTETLALFVRELALRKIDVRRAFFRELSVGVALGVASGVPMGLFGYWWFGDVRLGTTLVIAMTMNGVVAVVTGTLAPLLFAKLGRDPALGTDELTTAISDNVSMLLYFVVAMLILF